MVKVGDGVGDVALFIAEGGEVALEVGVSIGVSVGGGPHFSNCLASEVVCVWILEKHRFGVPQPGTLSLVGKRPTAVCRRATVQGWDEEQNLGFWWGHPWCSPHAVVFFWFGRIYDFRQVAAPVVN